MEKVRYMISDAASVVNVESHVLRYWEEELELNIPRNEMGHRYYTEENIRQFQKIKELKEQGYQLKAIKMLLQQMDEESGDEKTSIVPVNSAVKPADAMSRMEQFQMIMTDIVRKAVEENNRDLGKEVGDQVGERVLKEMNYLMREQEEQEEERFRKLDAAIRGAHKTLTKREKKPKLKLHTG